MDAPPVQYARTSDGFDIAYSVCGEGMPVLFPPLVHNHVQLDWINELTHLRRSPLLHKLAERFTVFNFDNRGQGMSSRGLTDDLTLEHFDLDTEAVARQIRREKFAFVAGARAGHLAIRYALRHPDRVIALVLMSPQLSMQAPPSGLFDVLPSQNWEFFLQTQIRPFLSPEDSHKAIEMLRQTTTLADYEQTWRVWRHSSIEDLLPQLTTPTLILHSRGHPFVPPEEATKVSARIPGARVTIIDGDDLFGDADQAVQAIEAFFDTLPPPPGTPTLQSRGGVPLASLSSRQSEVLHLLSLGYTNRQIADNLVLSVRTVERHLAEAYAKLGAHNRYEAIVLSGKLPTDSPAE